MQKVKKIDIHAHATPFPEFSPKHMVGERMISAEELIKKYDELNIERGILLPLTSSEYHPEQLTSGDCAYIAAQHPDRFWWFCGVDPRAYGHDEKADISKLLMHYKALGAKGVGECTPQLYFDDKLMDNFLYHCAECDMPITIHLAPQHGGYYGIIDDVGLIRMEKMLKKHKKLKILGHSAPFWSHISNDVSKETMNDYPQGKVTEGRLAHLLRDYENLYCDLSAGSGMNAIARDLDYGLRFLEEFADKVMYGCDICLNSQTFAKDFDALLDKFVADGSMTQENYQKFVRDNAIKILKL